MAERNTNFDYLRLIAMLLVFVQHAMSVQGHYEDTQVLGWSPGQLGVTIFCALSGFFAFTNSSAPGTWLKKRLLTIFPAYWIVTVAAFIIAFVFPSKKLTIWLFLSQMVGIGYFTHGWELVNVVSWFVSLILLCYFIAYVIKQVREAQWIAIVLLGICWVLVFLRIEVSLCRHIASFLLGAMLALYGKRISMLFIATSISLFIVAFLIDRQVAYSVFGSTVIMVAIWMPGNYSRLVSILSRYSYEFFLIHGIALVGFNQIGLGPSLLPPLFAFLLTLPAAWILKMLADRLAVLALSQPVLRGSAS